MKRKGRFTLPGESNFFDEIKEIMEKWGADAIRDNDGTKLDDEIKNRLLDGIMRKACRNRPLTEAQTKRNRYLSKPVQNAVPRLSPGISHPT